MRDRHLLERRASNRTTAVAEAFSLLDGAARDALVSKAEIHEAIKSTAHRWLVANGDHWALRVERRRPATKWFPLARTNDASAAKHCYCGCFGQHVGNVARRDLRTLPDAIAPKSPVAHLHVHLGPMLAFEELWGQLGGRFLRRRSLDTSRAGGIARRAKATICRISRGRGPSANPDSSGSGCWSKLSSRRAWLSAPTSTPLPSALAGLQRGRIDVESRGASLVAYWADDTWRRSAPASCRTDD